MFPQAGRYQRARTRLWTNVPNAFRQGKEITGQCPECKELASVYVVADKPARCVACGWEGEQAEYLTPPNTGRYRPRPKPG